MLSGRVVYGVGRRLALHQIQRHVKTSAKPLAQSRLIYSAVSAEHHHMTSPMTFHQLRSLIVLFHEFGLVDYEVEYIFRNSWRVVAELGRYRSFENCRRIVERLRSAGTPFSSVPVADALTHCPEILTWTVRELEICLEEAAVYGVPPTDFTSALLALQSRSCRREQALKAGELQRLMTTATEPGGSKRAIGDCLLLDQRLKLTKEDVDAFSRQLPSNEVLKKEITLAELNQLVFLMVNFGTRYPGKTKVGLLMDVWPLWIQEDFVNDLYPRIQFLKEYRLLEASIDLPTLLTLPTSQFAKHLSVVSIPVAYESYRRQLAVEDLEELLQDTSSDIEFTEFSKTLATRLLLYFINPTQLAQLIKSLKGVQVKSEMAYFYRWHLLGRIGFSATSILLHLPKLLKLSLEELRSRIEVTVAYRHRHPTDLSVTLDKVISATSAETLRQSLAPKLKKKSSACAVRSAAKPAKTQSPALSEEAGATAIAWGMQSADEWEQYWSGLLTAATQDAPPLGTEAPIAQSWPSATASQSATTQTPSSGDADFLPSATVASLSTLPAHMVKENRLTVALPAGARPQLLDLSTAAVPKQCRPTSSSCNGLPEMESRCGTNETGLVGPSS